MKPISPSPSLGLDLAARGLGIATQGLDVPCLGFRLTSLLLLLEYAAGPTSGINAAALALLRKPRGDMLEIFFS